MLAGLGALEKQVMDLTSKLGQGCSVGGGSSAKEPWIRDQPVPSNWVCFSELDVLVFSKNTALTITKATSGSKFRDDKTTNIQANCFYRGIFPILVVDVAELTSPDREECDPSIWGLHNNAGINYVARKPFA
ncbi:hypothetical protein MKX01_004896 [Papaver californicum]|nr:hypothetical protein MKX01_004896 [Papaver californicum]